LIKLNNRFEIDTTGGWSQNTIFPFSGSVVNTANCKIALDEYGNFYMIETFQDTNTGNLRQKIVKRYPDGNYDRSTWKEISANRYWDRTRKYRDENFNGIFIRNGNLYVTYTGYDDTANIALSKFLKHRLDLVDDSLTEVIAGNNYLGADAEIFSFVVDDNETHYSMNNNLKYGSTSQIVLTAYFRNGTNRRYNINTDPFFTDPVFDILGANPVVVSRPSITLVDPAFQARWDTLFPKICIDTYNQIFIGNGVRIIRVNLDASNNIVLPVIPSDKSETVTRFLDAGTSRQVPEYLRGPSGITVIRRAAYWERSHLTIDEAGDLYSIYYAKAIVKFNIKRSLGESRYVLCKQLRQLLPDDGIPRDFTATSVELWVDGVNFVGPSFSETCIGVENVYIDFPGRMYPVSSFDVLHQRSAAQTVGSDIGLNTGRIRGSGSSVYVIIGTGDTVNTCRNAVTNNVLTLPTNAGRMLVDPIVGDGVPVNIDFKINRDIIRSYTLTFDTTNFFIRNTLRIDDDSSSFDVLSFNEPVYAYGCRTLYMEIRNSSGQSVIGPDKLIVYVRSTSVKIPNRLQFNQTYTITLSFPRFSSINHSFTYTPSPRYYAFYPRNVIHIIKFVSATQIESSLIRLTGSDVNADPSPTRKYTAQCRQLYNYTVNGNDYNISVSTSVLILCDGQETRTGVTTNSYGTLLQSTGTRTARYNSSNDEFSLDMWNNINRPTQCSTESSEWFNLSRPLTYKRLIVPSIGC
jgi:hypothetical protein